MKASAFIRLVLPLIAVSFLSCGGGGGGGGGPDPVGFKVKNVQPLHGATDVNQYQSPTVTFTQSLNVSTVIGAFGLYDSSGPIEGTIIVVDSAEKTIRFDPTEKLDLARTYTIWLDASIENRDGKELGESQQFSFTTDEDPSDKKIEAGDFKRTWTDLTVGRSQHTATLLDNGSVLLAGGYRNSTQTTPTAELYDPEEFSFAPSTHQLSNARARHTATLLLDGRVLIAGGVGTGSVGSLETCEIYDPIADSFSTTGALLQKRSLHTAERLPDGRVVVFGGEYRNDADEFVLVDLAEIFDPVTGRWSQIPDLMVRGRSAHTSTVLDSGKILLVGGGLDQAAELFDPSNLTFTRTSGNTMSWRWSHTAVLLENGLVLICGGGSARGEFYLPDSDSFAHVSNGLAFDRYFHTASVMPNGGFLFLGGTFFGDQTIFLSSMDRFSFSQSPTGSFFHVVYALAEPRTNHTATVLQDGSILIAGGMNVDPLEPEMKTALLFRQDD